MHIDELRVELHRVADVEPVVGSDKAIGDVVRAGRRRRRQRRVTSGTALVLALAVVVGGIGILGHRDDLDAPAGNTNLRVAAAASVDGRTARVTQVDAVDGRVIYRATGVVDFARDRGSLASSADALDVFDDDPDFRHVDMQAQWFGTTEYTRFKFAGPWTIWFRTTRGHPSGALDPAMASSLDFERLMAALGSVTGTADEVGPERIDGVPTTHMRVRIATQRDASTLGKLFGIQVPTVPMGIDYWVDSSRRLARVVVTQSAPSFEQPSSERKVRWTYTISFADWGTPVDLDEPPAGRVLRIDDGYDYFDPAGKWRQRATGTTDTVRWRFFEASGRRGECYAFAFDPPLRDRDTFDETNADPTSSYTCGPLPDVLDHSFPVFVAAGGRSDTGHYAVLAGVVADAVTKVEIVWKDGVHTSVPIEDPNYFVHIWRDDRVPDRVEVGTDHGRTVSCARQTNTLYSCDP